MNEPFSCPEQFALDEATRDRSAIHLDQRPSVSLACGVDRSCNQLYSGAGFARNEDRAIRFGKSAYLLGLLLV